MTAVIRWKSPEEGGRKTPPGPHYRTVAHFLDDTRWPADAWTLVLDTRWLSPEGRFTVADVAFLAEGAPAHLLTPRAKFELLEGNRVVATGIVLPSERTLDQVAQLAAAI